MPTRDEDVRKVHAAVNQIDNQRTLLSILAITVFGTSAGWWVSKTPQPGSDASLLFIFSMILVTVLLLIFYYSFCLKRFLRVFTTYLIIKNASDWETDMQKFRNECRSNIEWHERPQAMVFLVLGIAAGALPFVLRWSLALPWGLRRWPVMHTCWVSFYLIVVIGLGFLNLFDHESSTQARWTQVLFAPSAQAK